PIGEPVDFDLFLRPTFPSFGATDFDRLRVIAPSQAEMTLRSVDLGDEGDFTAATTESFVRDGATQFSNASGEVLFVSGDGTDTLLVELPTAVSSSSPDLVRLSFTTSVFQSGSTFRLEAARSSRPDAWQAADGGDAVGDELSIGGGTTVLTPLGGSDILLGDETSRVFTPNGDGFNDTGLFEFAVLRINVDREVGVDIHDLSGRLIRRLRETRANGLYRLEWDGLDEEDQLVPPGIYIVRYKVDADAGGSTPTGLVSVAY
ncbi:MAG: hypothetical protein VX290_08860, partial [Candidatus Latescibacterota bacterium]|nr:hypothetical protein [Candidatus Latescibacterota bacterium]